MVGNESTDAHELQSIRPTVRRRDQYRLAVEVSVSDSPCIHSGDSRAVSQVIPEIGFEPLRRREGKEHGAGIASCA
jgi:hypothetical protein